MQISVSLIGIQQLSLTGYDGPYEALPRQESVGSRLGPFEGVYFNNIFQYKQFSSSSRLVVVTSGTLFIYIVIYVIQIG